MNHTQAPFLRGEKSPASAVLASVLVITAMYVYFLIFAGFAFVDFAQTVVPKARMQWVVAVLGLSGVIGCFLAARKFDPVKGRVHLAGGFAGCLLAALITLLARYEAVIMFSAALVGVSTAWTAVSLSLCLRPTLHFNRLGLWCGLGTGLAYALCNQPFIFEGSVNGKIITGIVAAAVGLLAAFRMRALPMRPSSLPDYEPQGATGWIVAMFALVFLDTLVFFIIQNSITLKQLSWETPLILQGNAFVHICAAYITGLVLDQRWPGLSALVALLLLITSCIVLGLHIEHFPKARMLYIAAVSIYSTIMVYLPARGGRPQFTAVLFAVSGWVASGLALSIAIAVDARRVPPYAIGIAMIVGLSGLFTRLLWLKRTQETESERMATRRPAESG